MTRTNSHSLVIGVSACIFHHDPLRPIFKNKRLLYMEESMSQYLMNCGAIPCLIPTPHQDIDLESMIDRVDGLLLQGGSDVSPKSYGEPILHPDWTGDHFRDQYEIKLIKLAVARNKPILGICRGAQILNVAMGGTLYQDITTQVQDSLEHRNWDIYDQNFHRVKFTQDSLLCKIFPDLTESTINSVHHQSIKDLGDKLIKEAESVEDGIVEAVRLDDSKRFALGIQWHPEFQDLESMTDRDGNEYDHGLNQKTLNPLKIMDHFLTEVRARTS